MDFKVNKNTKSIHTRRNLWSGILIGIGLAAFVDETVFHQLLHWHHFYDKSTTNLGLVSDGIFHAFSWFATVGGFFMYADLKRREALWRAKWVGGILAGAGFFQVYDGTIHHKVMRLHQIRYVEDLFIYDLVWNVTGLLIFLAGLFLIMRNRTWHHG